MAGSIGRFCGEYAEILIFDCVKDLIDHALRDVPVTRIQEIPDDYCEKTQNQDAHE